MTTDTPSKTYTINADTTSFDAAMKAATESTRGFGRVFTSTMARAVTSGKGLDSTLRSLAMRMATMALNSAMEPVETAISKSVEAVLAAALTPTGYKMGGAFSPSGPVTAFANGGVVNGATLFGYSGGTGVMGEAGPEAILPLRRGPDGRLGVGAGEAATAPLNVVFNVNATDAESFRRSEGQVTAMLARAVSRGSRNI